MAHFKALSDVFKWAKVKVIHHIGKTLLKGLKSALNGFICISLSYMCTYMCVFLSVYLCGYKGSQLVSMENEPK